MAESRIVLPLARRSLPNESTFFPRRSHGGPAMSRAFNLAMTEADVVKHCTDKSIAISALEALPGGGTRLVCMSGYGAAQIEAKLKTRIIKGTVRREQFGRRKPIW